MACKSLEKTKPKLKHKKGLWSPDEDQRLRNRILRHGHGCWSSVPKFAGLQRNGKSCRLRWINYLRPGLKRGTFDTQEQDTIISLHRKLGNKWSQIAQNLPGRTDNEIKNFWHSHLKKKLSTMNKEEVETISKNELTNSTIQEDIKSNTTISTLDSSRNNDSFAIDSKQSTTSNQQSYLPKIFFAEWLTLDDMIIEQNNNNNIHIDQITYINSNNNNIDQNYNVDINGSFSQGATTYNQESCGSDEFFNGIDDFVFESSQLKFEDQALETSLNDLFFVWG
ncbi:hypothetical protein RND81_05G085400 [Saponaria officinalis]|uniref:Uncharacterized protein n=1 Tax=Saponaria officinalis TaxID=3572 RepID=A0AAW1KVR2_SAPOF